MKLRDKILSEHSNAHARKIAGYIGTDPERFRELMDLFLDENYRINQRSSLSVLFCVEKHPDLITPYIKPILQNLEHTSVSVRRNSLRILQLIDIPEELCGLAAEICFEFLASPKVPVAIKAFSMTIIHNISQKEPDLKNELKILIEDQLPYASSGFVSRGQKILRAINKGNQL